MNQHTASEHAAAITLREHAHHLSKAYTKEPQDLAAARLVLLAEALEQEMRQQKDNQRLMFVSAGCLKSVHTFVTTGREDGLLDELMGLLESINYGGEK